jgi:hypothetical protein
VYIDIPRFGITGGTCPSDSVEGDSGMKDVKLIIPDQFASPCVEAGDAFLFGDVAPDAPDNVDSVVENDRCGASYKICLPEKIFTFN